MALETISQILSPENATYINGVSAERRFAPATLKNLYQGLVEKNGRGITDKFVSSEDAQSSAQVFVNRILPIKMSAREQGASKNGASFSANQHYVQTETVGIEILTVLDDPIIIPRARQNQINVDLLAEEVEIYSNRLKTILNGATFGSKVMGVLVAKSQGKSVNEKVIDSTDISNGKVLNRFVEANGLLDEGDEEHGIDMFPDDTKVAVFKPSWRATLKTSGILVVGGANYAYDIARKGGVDSIATPRKMEDGYIGDIDEVPCHIISNEALTHAAGFCGFPDNEFKHDDLIGYVSSGWANARGVSESATTKIVDAVNGQGIVLQPYTKFGVASWYPKGNCLLEGANTYNLVADLKTILAGDAGDVTFKLKAAGSRLWAVGGTFTFTSTTAFTLSGVTCPDDWNADHLVKVIWFVGDNAVSTVDGFLKGYSGATYKGSFGKTGVGQAVTTTIASNKYVNALVLADDGSCSLLSKANA